MMKRSFLLLALSGMCLLTACSYTQQKRPSTNNSTTTSAPPIMAEEERIPSKGVVPAGAPIIKIALLVPMSGESAAVGNAMLDAATLAVHNNYGNTLSDQIKSQIVLLPKDTGNTPADSVRVAKQAIEQGAKFMIGPLFSQSVTAIAPMAKEAGVTMLTFSNNKAVASDGVYTFGFLPEQQVERIAEYAFLHNIQRVAVLAPNDAYGEKVLETLKREFGRRGGLIAHNELYAPSPANIDAAVSRLAAAYGNAQDTRKFQAIFIADGGYQLKNILASIQKTSIDLSKIQLLGTGLWDDPEVAKILAMTGAWFPSAPPAPYAKFEQHFTTVYGYKPVRLASLAYDATMLATTLAMASPDGFINKAALTDPQGYVGTANSLYRLRQDGTSERKLAILEITPGGFTVIDPAPKSFEK